MSRNTAIITGAAGWLGSRLVECLLEGLPDGPEMNTTGPHREVRALVEPGVPRHLLAHVADRVTFVEGDVTDPGSLTSLFRDSAGGTLFHCAGILNPWRVGLFYRVNVEGTCNVLAAARKAGIRRVVHVSADSVLGVNATPEETFDELSAYAPHTHYGRSKTLAERAVWESACSGGAQAVVVRPATFYGPNQPSSRSALLRLVKSGRFPLVGDGNNRRSLVYVDNVVQVMLLSEAIERARGQTYWVADARDYRMREIVDVVEMVLERDFGQPVARRRLRLPHFLSRAAGAARTVLGAVGLHAPRLHALADLDRNIACRSKKAKEELGYDPRVDLEEGIRRGIRWSLDSGETLD